MVKEWGDPLFYLCRKSSEGKAALYGEKEILRESRRNGGGMH